MRPFAPLPSSLRRCLGAFPDKVSRAECDLSHRRHRDGGVLGFLFFMQSPSFLTHQRRLEHGHGRSNCESLFAIPEIPSDDYIRDMLDPADPDFLFPVFAQTLAALERMPGGSEAFHRLSGHVLIALDGTEHFCSKIVH